MWIPKFVQKLIDDKAEVLTRMRMIESNGRVRDLRGEIVKLETEIKRYERARVVDINMGDPLPADPVKRREYVGAVAGLYHTVLEPKLTQMISRTRELLESEENTRDQDLQLKGTAYAFWEIIRWGKMMVSEEAAYVAGEHPSVPEDKDKGNEN